jgi:hypothetical protein
MFVTAEVPENQIDAAFEGIRALRFSGAAFLPPHRTAGARLVDSLTESALRSGQVRIARRDGDSWLGEDILGASIVEHLKFEQSVSASDGRILFHGRDSLTHLFRIAAPESWRDKLIELSLDSAVRNTSVSEINEALDCPATPNASSAKLSLDALPAEQAPIEVLIVDGSVTAPSARSLAKLSWSEQPTCVLVDPNASWDAALNGAKLKNLRIVRASEIAAAKAAVSFHFWTGCTTELLLIRDALDEYCQW